MLCCPSAESSTGGAPPAEAKKRSSCNATWSRNGKKTSLSVPSASVYQSLLLDPGAAPNAILRPGPHIGGAPGPPGASIGAKYGESLGSNRIERRPRIVGEVA